METSLGSKRSKLNNLELEPMISESFSASIKWINEYLPHWSCCKNHKATSTGPAIVGSYFP